MFRLLLRAIRTHLGFSRSESNALVILLPLIVAILFSEPAYRAWKGRQTEAPPHLQGFGLSADDEDDTGAQALVDAPVPERFPFNPNTISETELLRLGLTPRLARQWIRYRTQGGRFRQPSDLRKLYGMDSLTAATLMPWVELPAEGPSGSTPPRTPKYARPMPAPFDMNEADTARWMEVKGIGPILARRIVRYRDRLGGFVEPQQLYEVYGLDSTAAQEALHWGSVAPDFQPRKIAVNQADEKTLLQLPYLTPRQARAIITYRFQHGPFSSWHDLTKIHSIDTLTWKRIKPYLTLSP